MSKVINRDLEVYGDLSISGTINPNPSIVTYGKVFYVDYDNGNDANTGLSMTKAVKTVKRAYDLARTNKNDVICLSAYSAHALTQMLTVSKNRIHFVGLGIGRRKYGQRAKISLGVTTDTLDVAIMKNVGIGNTFSNIKFESNNSLAQALAVVQEGGEYTSYSNCEFYRSTLLNGATSCELALNGDSTQFYECTFGSLADPIVGDVIHPCVRLAASVVSGGAGSSKDVLFQGCNFWRSAGGTTTSFVHSAADADLQRIMEFKDCIFVNTKNATAVPAVAISLAASLTASQIILTGHTVAVNCTKIGTGTGIINCTPARVATATIGIQGT